MRDIMNLLEATPNGRLQGMKFYHGTPTTRQAEGILRHGLQPGQQTSYAHELRPADGHVYLSSDPYYAIKYALGQDAKRKSAAEYDDRFCYLFIFTGRDLTEVVPDEDSIGDFLWLHTVPTNDGGKGKAAWTYDLRWNRSEDEAVHRQIWEFLFKHATPKELKGCCTLGPNRPYAWAAFGKRMQAILPDKISLKMIELGAHIAHGGSIMPSACWRLSRNYQHQIDSPGRSST